MDAVEENVSLIQRRSEEEEYCIIAGPVVSLFFILFNLKDRVNWQDSQCC